MPVGVYAFCDGWGEKDRVALFQMVGKAGKARVFVCSPGKGKGEHFNTPERVLAEINVGAAEAGHPPLRYHSSLPGRLAGARSCGNKTLFVMLRTGQ